MKVWENNKIYLFLFILYFHVTLFKSITFTLVESQIPEIQKKNGRITISILKMFCLYFICCLKNDYL